MAPYGQPSYVDKVWKLINQNRDGSFSLDMDYFCFHHSTEQTYNSKFAELFGDSASGQDAVLHRGDRLPEILRRASGELEGAVEAEPALRRHRRQHPAGDRRCAGRHGQASAQDTGLKKLCMAGGVGLNSVANTRILQRVRLRGLYVQPAAGDGGGALGAALWAYNTLLGKPRSFQMEHAYWGRANSEAEIGDFLRQNNIQHTHYDNEDKLLDAVVDQLTSAKVIGWSQGRFEWGPRALGSRSILADPRNPDMKDIVNTKIKFREPYRPFAPSVLAECAEKYFDLPDGDEHSPARYMLYVVPVKPKPEGEPAGDHPRRRHRPPADGVQGSEPALLQDDRALRAGNRRAGGHEHLVQPEGRADRQHSGERLQHVLQERDGRAGAGKLHHREELGFSEEGSAEKSCRALRHTRTAVEPCPATRVLGVRVDRRPDSRRHQGAGILD